VPYYYSISKTPGTPGTACTTNGGANTLSTHFRFATVANQMVARIMGLFAASRFGTAGGAALYLVRPGTIGSGGTANTPASKKGTLNRAADTTAFDDATAITPGATPIQQQAVGFAQTGGQGGWVALEPMTVTRWRRTRARTASSRSPRKANTASVTFDPTINLQEG
jgi:hypothetical protein